MSSLTESHPIPPNALFYLRYEKNFRDVSSAMYTCTNVFVDIINEHLEKSKNLSAGVCTSSVYILIKFNHPEIPHHLLEDSFFTNCLIKRVSEKFSDVGYEVLYQRNSLDDIIKIYVRYV